MRFPIIALAFLVALPSVAQNYTLVWADEFDYTGLPDATKWIYDVGGNGWGNQELQYYTEADLDNASVADGKLTITARLEELGGRNYTSARLLTRGLGEWTYGRFEVRAKLPAGVGTWPAIWMLYAQGTYGSGGWPDNGEIDIMEHVGFDPGRVHATIHTNAFNHMNGTQVGAQTMVPDFDEAFHDYALEWSPSGLRVYVDDVLYFTYDNPGTDWTEWPFDHPMFMILNIAIGGTWGGQQGVDDSIFPVSMEVDYVRVYQDLEPEPTVAITSPEPEQHFAVGEVIAIEGTANDAAPGVARIEMMQGDGVLRVLEGGSLGVFEEEVTGAVPGCYEIRVRAIDGDGYEASTEPVPISVGDPATCPQAPYLIAAHPVGATGEDVVEAEYYDLGGAGVAYFDLGEANTGSGGIRLDEGVDIESTQDFGGGHNVTNIVRQEWIEYILDVQRAGRYTVDVRVAAGVSGGEFLLTVDGEDVAGSVSFLDTGGLQNWSSVRVTDVMLEEGIQTLRFTATKSGFNLGKFTFRLVEPVSTQEDVALQQLWLSSVYPNPVEDRARFAFHLAEAGPVSLAVFDVMGRRVATLVDGVRIGGQHTAELTAGILPSGTYVVILQTAKGRATQRFVVAR